MATLYSRLCLQWRVPTPALQQLAGGLSFRHPAPYLPPMEAGTNFAKRTNFFYVGRLLAPTGPENGAVWGKRRNSVSRI